MPNLYFATDQEYCREDQLFILSKLDVGETIFCKFSHVDEERALLSREFPIDSGCEITDILWEGSKILMEVTLVEDSVSFLQTEFVEFEQI